MKHILYLALVLSALAVAQQPPPLVETVLFRSETKAYQLLPVEDLGLEGVVGVQVLNERTLLVHSRQSGGLHSTTEHPPSAGEFEAVLFDIQTRRKTTPSGAGFDSSTQFMIESATNDSATIRRFTPQGLSTAFFWLNFSTGRVTELPANIARPIVMPGMRLVDVLPGLLVVFDSRGVEIARHAVPEKTGLSGTGRSDDELVLSQKVEGSPTFHFFTINVRTGEQRTYSREEWRAQFSASTEMEYRLIPHTIEGVPFEPDHSSWRLVPGQSEIATQSANSPTAQVATRTAPPTSIPKPHELPRGCTLAVGATKAELIGTSTVLIVRDERVAIQRIAEVSIADYEAYVRSQVQREAMVAAKMTSTAAMIYASDYDGHLPLGNYGDSLKPYMSDPSLLDGMTFTFNGESLNDIENPAETAFGWKDTAYGRAIAYGDGSVRWRPNP